MKVVDRKDFKEVVQWFIDNESAHDCISLDEYYDAYKSSLKSAQSEALSVGNNEQAKEDWYCPTCKVLVGGENITYDELHEACGTFLGNQSD
ncbi:hypothetical protein [Roseivirga pacifica]|uniref:hypothetical protein n=1 Tax=Roseivirga pacifica TaxID=1267423 RepID=UPI0020941FD3|nr:hypothetical protein [Roseivirga pacifica]MCO6358567.1 hypothetical protein [Roseivirga pacifica]MCO6366643.1 hypothetical protein [Roseivirga pacifica]MCO6369307.1 hypothetical protein [Roseivirga pacifica]MCO6374311.1 hypothetical protein [Roseivirga pacifica]MCO6378499.1 hypothetical protein [Roseivirga pacifica]